MAIRLEKDTLLNWINEMGKFLRLVIEKWESGLEGEEDSDMEEGYREFFGQERAFFASMEAAVLKDYATNTLKEEQIRPLALLMMYDGFIRGDKGLLVKAKSLLEQHAAATGSFSFEDFDHLAKIDRKLKEEE